MADIGDDISSTPVRIIGTSLLADVGTTDYMLPEPPDPIEGPEPGLYKGMHIIGHSYVWDSMALEGEGAWVRNMWATLGAGAYIDMVYKSGCWNGARTFGMPSFHNLANRGYFQLTDGTNVMPMMDVVGRAGFQKITDGTNLMPTMDVVGRPGFVKLTDGTETATITPDGHQEVTSHSNHQGFSIAYSPAIAPGATTGYVLIDLSDSTNYPHTNTGEVHIDWIIFTYLASTTAEGYIDVGFIKSITADNADWYSITHALIDKKETEHPVMLNFHPSCVVCTTAQHLAGGSMFFNDDATFQNDTALAATHATAIPAVGDIVAKVTLTAGSVNFAITIGYHTEA